eukprot:g4959.t2
MPDATGSRAMSKKPKRLLERVTLLGSCAQLRLDVPVGITVAEARQRVEESWGWAAGRLLFFAADSALIWDDDYQLVGGSIVVGRAPLPLTVVFRLIAVTSRLVNHKVPLLVPGGARARQRRGAGALATAKNACASLGRHLGIPGSELLEVVLLEAKEQPAALEDEENLEALQLRSAIIRFRRPAQRMVLELLKMRLLWPLGKQGCRPPPQELGDSWSISVPDLGDSALETLEATQQVLRCAASEAQDLVFHATEDAYRWRVELQRPLPAQGLEKATTDIQVRQGNTVGCSTMTFIQLTLDPTGSNIAQATGVRLDDASGTGQTIPVDSEGTCSTLLAVSSSAKAYSYQSSSGSCVLSNALSRWTPDPEFSGGAKAEVYNELCGLKCQAQNITTITMVHHEQIYCQCCLNYRVDYAAWSGSCVLSALSHWTPDPEFSGGAKAEVFPELCGLKCQALQDVDVAAINVGHHNPITCQCCLNYRVNYAASKNRYYRCAGAVCTECSNSPGPGLSSDVTASASSSWNHWSGWCSSALVTRTAYSYWPSDSSCRLFSELSAWTDAPELVSGAKVEVFPQLSGLLCQAKHPLPMLPQPCGTQQQASIDRVLQLFGLRVPPKCGTAVEPAPSADGEMVEFVVTFPAEYPLKPVRLEGSLLLDGQEVPMDQIFSGDRWSPANTVYCALGEVVDFMMLHRTEEEVGDGKPRIPRLPLS